MYKYLRICKYKYACKYCFCQKSTSSVHICAHKSTKCIRVAEERMRTCTNPSGCIANIMAGSMFIIMLGSEGSIALGSF